MGAASDDQRSRLARTVRTDRRTVRFDLPVAARVDQLDAAGEVANFSAFVRDAVAEKLERETDV